LRGGAIDVPAQRERIRAVSRDAHLGRSQQPVLDRVDERARGGQRDSDEGDLEQAELPYPQRRDALGRAAAQAEQQQARDHRDARGHACVRQAEQQPVLLPRVNVKRPSIQARPATIASADQNITLGPSRGPPAKSTQRLSGTVSSTCEFTEGAPRSSALLRYITAVPRGSRQPIATSRAPGVSVSGTRSPSWRSGCSTPFTTSNVVPAGGSVIACWP
jgi:hypothetical protein